MNRRIDARYWALWLLGCAAYAGVVVVIAEVTR